MLIFSGQTVVFIGLATLAFVSYCIYFDHKRRKDPFYRRRVHERRKRELTKANQEQHLSAEVVENFLRHVYQGETCVRDKDWDMAVHYFANAIMLCADPQILLRKLKVAVPIELYELIIAKVNMLFKKSSNDWGQLSSSITDLTTSSQELTDLPTLCTACTIEPTSN